MASEPGGRSYEGLLVDWGGVLTTNLFESFGAFCRKEGLEPDTIMRRFAGDRQTRELLIELECGRLPPLDFERRLAEHLAVPAEGLIERMFAGSLPEESMIAAVRAARRAGVHTGLISNSWVEDHYDPALLGELFDGIVISGREGIRKPAPRMYELGAQRAGVPAERCVYVDDLPFNLKPAAELGMATVHHVEPARTIAELERLLGLALR